jgi:hypothetical protein
MKRVTPAVLLSALLLLPALAGQPRTLTIAVDAPAKPISPDLFGIFFEDLNYAADGGLYAELLQNRSFEYSATEQSGGRSPSGISSSRTRATASSGSATCGRSTPTIPNTCC